MNINNIIYIDEEYRRMNVDHWIQTNKYRPRNIDKII